MKKPIILLISNILFIAVCLFCKVNANANPSYSDKPKVPLDTYEGYQITKEGAWCWFADPRALHYQNTSGTINSSYIGYIDTHGNIKATQHNFITGKSHEVLIRSYFQPDDHDNPSFLVLPDERIMIFYSRHTDEACFYYRISKKAGDITSLGEEIKIITSHNTTYPSPFIMADDPTHFYLCWRGINWHPTIARLTIPDSNDNVSIDWGPYQMVQSTGARPYCKYFSNGKDKIYMTYTTGHPDNEFPNYVYFNYIDINTLQLKDITGTVLSSIASGPHNVNKTTYPASFPNAVVDNPTDQRDWVWQTSVDTSGNPVIAMVQISNDKTVHNYYYAKWTGTGWRKTFLANGGGHFHQTPGLELCYSGGMAIGGPNSDMVYCSVPVTGVSGSVYEIIKYSIGNDGTLTSSEQITHNSILNNVRPYIVANSGNSPLKLVWMHGNYYDWIVSSSRPLGYPTAIHSDFVLPEDNINLADGLVVNEDFSGSIAGTAHTTEGVLVSTKNTYATLAASASPSFSISLTPYIYEGAYEGVIVKTGNLTYGLNGTTMKPYTKIGDITYNSTNLLGNSDSWKTQARGTGGVWWPPIKLKYFNLTITYENAVLKIFRNGLIDQVIEAEGLNLNDVTLGGFNGWVEDCRIYSRALTQAEVKKITETSLAYSFNNNLSAEMELEALYIPENIYTDVVLANRSFSGNTITWTTDNNALVTNSGLITSPAIPTSVTLTATINAQSRTFNVTVFPRNIENNKVFKYTFEAADTYSLDNISYVKDKSGNGNDASISGSALVNGTLDLSANTAGGFSTNGYAMAPAGIINNLRSYSFLAKVKPGSLTSAPRIFDFGSSSANSIFLRAAAFSAGYKYNGAATTLINSPAVLTAGQEAKVAMTFDARTQTTKIYLNGTETASATTIVNEPYQLSNIAANTRNYIGRTQWWDTSVASSNIDFKGTMDDIFLFDVALTADEIAQIQNNPTTRNEQLKKNDALLIYPNPVKCNDVAQIDYKFAPNEMNNLKVMIIDVLGKTTQLFHPASFPIGITGLNKQGIFLIHIVSGTGNIYRSKLFVK